MVVPEDNTPYSRNNRYNEYNPDFDMTPAQFHQIIDEFWKALGLTTPQLESIFTLAIRAIKDKKCPYCHMEN